MPDSDTPRSAPLETWREAMAQLRYLNDEVWKRFQFFIWLELALLVLAGGSIAQRSIISSFLFFVLELFVGVIARNILRRNRGYYLQMLARKSLIEQELGFYDNKFSGTNIDHAMPWRLTPEVVEKIRQNPEAWTESNIRPKGTIAQYLFCLVEIFIALNCLGLAAGVIAIFRA